MADRLDADPDAGRQGPGANRTVAWAGIAALEGRRDEALAGFRDACRRYRELGADFPFAWIVLDALILLGPEEPAIRDQADEARAIFERVRAVPYLEWLDAALRQPAHPPLATTRVVVARGT
ncbi:MAG TPA: hypothetical protein VNF73_11475 [Candidatus Saccharimonadales bacterium]|nr:hypothetical protein [Candidatus Saccharimonadales bacterium]